MKNKKLAIVFALLLMLSIFAGGCSSSKKGTDENVLRHCVARIYVGDQYTQGSWSEPVWDPVSRGTGFFIGESGKDPQYMITNRHVIDYYLQWDQGERTNAYNQQGELVAYARTQIRVYFSSDANDYVEAYLVEAGDTESKDFAILRLAEPTTKRSAMPLCIPTQDMSDPNKSVYTVGFPGAADNEALRAVSQSNETDALITRGMINKLFVQTGTGVQTIQFDATIRSGNSGGPLVFENGAAVGVTTWSVADTDENMYYAVSMEFIKPYLDKNSVPYTLVGAKNSLNWLPYAILGAAILGVVVVLILVLRKPKKQAAPVVVTPEPKPVTQQTGPATNNVPNPPVRNLQKRYLIGIDGPLKDKRFTLEAGRSLYIGRDRQKCNVLFPDQTPGVSNMHCKISFDGNTATITDLKSSYGTAVDGKKLIPNNTITLHRGLVIEIGSKTNRFTLQ